MPWPKRTPDMSQSSSADWQGSRPEPQLRVCQRRVFAYPGCFPGPARSPGTASPGLPMGEVGEALSPPVLPQGDGERVVLIWIGVPADQQP